MSLIVKYVIEDIKEMKDKQEVKDDPAALKQPYTVFSWKYDAEKNKVKDDSDALKQPYTVFSWKYDAEKNKVKDDSDALKQPYTVFSWKYDAEKNKVKDDSDALKQPYTVFSWKYDAEKNKVKDDSATLKQPYTVFSWKYNENDRSNIAAHHHDHMLDNDNYNDQEDLTGGSVFFVEKSLHLGSKLKHDFQKTPKKSFLPKQVAQSMPFSMDKIDDILNLFSLKSDSAQANAIKGTLDVCLQRPKVMKENRTCAQSMEDIVDFFVQELGTNEVEIKMMNNKNEVPDGIQDYVLTKVKKLVVPGNTAVACHRMSYPYVVYYCHHQQDIGQYDVTLVSPTTGAAFQTTAVCHYDTYAWQPDVVALKYLGIRPGDAPVCHFSAINDMFWTLKVDPKSLDMIR